MDVKTTELDPPGETDMTPSSRRPAPAYLTIARTLEHRITSGEYSPGCRLPSGAQLCTEFGVSPMTVRRALQILEDHGLVTARQGQGTFARSFDLSESLFHLDFLGGEWLDASADIRLLSASMTRADEKVAEKLALPERQMVIHLRRLVLYAGEPAMHHTEYIIYDPRRPLVESQLQLTSLHAFLDSGKAHRFPHGELTLTSVNLDSDSANALGEEAGASALRLEHVFHDIDGTPVSWGWFLLRAGLFRLCARLGSD